MANKIKGLTIEIGGETTLLQKSMKEVNTTTKNLKTELRDVERLLKLDPGNTDLISQKQKVLADSIGTTKDKLEQLKQAEKEVQEQFEKGEVSEEQFRALQREVIKTEGELKKLEKASKDFGTNISRSLEDAGKKMQDFGGKVEGAGKKLAPISAVAAGAVGASVAVFTSFDDSMKQVQATMGGTAEDYDKLSKAAQDMGAKTRYSASESADALNYLALAGYDTEKAIEALPKVLNLAQAGGLDLAYASDLVTDSMSALGLETSYADTFIDQLAKTSQKSNTNVGQLGEAILTVGGTAKILKGGTVELSTQLGILADNGIKGAEGGTALRNVLLSLSAPTKKQWEMMELLGLKSYDANGELKSTDEIFQDLNEILSTMNDEEKTSVLSELFNKVDLKAANALLANSGERFGDLSSQIANSEGAAGKMAETMESGLGGSFRSLKSAIEGVAIGLGEALAPTIQALSEHIKKLADWFNGLTDTQKQLIATILVLVAGLAPLLLIIGKIITVVGTITSALPALGAAFAVLTGPIGLVIAAVAAVIAIGVLLYKNWDKIVEFAKEIFTIMWEFIIEVWEGIKETFTDAIKSLGELATQIWTAVWDAFKSVWESIKTWLSESWNNLVTFVTGFKDKLKEAAIIVFTFLWDGLKNVWTTISEWVSGAFTGLVTFITNFKEKLKTAAITIFTFLWDGLKNVWTTITTWVSEKFENMKTTIVGFKDKFKQAGTDIFQGLWDGIKGMWTKISSWVTEKVNWIKDKLSVWKSAANDMSNSSSPRDWDGSNRTGLARVPFDGYVSELHKNEEILRADDPRNQNNNKTMNTAINHSGTIRVEGVNNAGELNSVVDIVMDQLRREVRMA